MSLAVAISSLPSLVLWIWVSIGVILRLLGGAADRDLDHRNRPGRTSKCSREAASQAGLESCWRRLAGGSAGLDATREEADSGGRDQRQRQAAEHEQRDRNRVGRARPELA